MLMVIFFILDLEAFVKGLQKQSDEAKSKTSQPKKDDKSDDDMALD